MLLLTTALFAAGRAQLQVVPGPKPLAVSPAKVSLVYPSYHSYHFAAYAESDARVDMRHSTTPPTLPAAFRVEDLALFCRIEVHLEKAARIPVRFRLGSVDYVDYLEGKRDYIHYTRE